MRVISQDGTRDFPYESIGLGVLTHTDSEIFAVSMSVPESGNKQCIAIYSTEEKALKAMEMLHDAYCGLCEIKTKEPEKPANIDPGVFMVQYTSCKPNGEYSVWRFPKDEELE